MTDNSSFRKRDRQIVDFVARHRIASNEVLHKLYFTGSKRNAETKVTARLCKANWLCQYPLYHPRHYFTLGPLAASRLGIRQQRTGPLGPQSLPIEYAALMYSFGKSNHMRLTSTELQQRFPHLAGPLADFPYCIDSSGVVDVLDLLRIDLGGKPDYVARKCKSDVDARLGSPTFATSIKEGRFRHVVITGTAGKASLIQRALEQHIWPDGMSLHLAVVPELLQLTARINHGA